jgi:hypothetical protein
MAMLRNGRRVQKQLLQRYSNSSKEKFGIRRNSVGSQLKGYGPAISSIVDELAAVIPVCSLVVVRRWSQSGTYY